MRNAFLLCGALVLAACTENKTVSTNATPDATANEPPDPNAPKNAPPAPADVGAAPPDATKTSTGLATKVLAPGTGKDHPGPSDTVKVHYTGWTKAGKAFDSSIGNDPLEFDVGQVIAGWTEGLQLMVAGEKRRLWIPGALAYGDKPRGGAPGGDLVFDVELLSIKQAPKPPEVPADVKAVPADAKKTASGLAYKVLRPARARRTRRRPTR